MNLAKKGEELYLRNIIRDVLGYVPVCEGQQLERMRKGTVLVSLLRYLFRVSHFFCFKRHLRWPCTLLLFFFFLAGPCLSSTF